MIHDSDYCRRRAAEALAAASHKDESEATQIAGDLALAYAALAKRRMAATVADTDPRIVETALQQ